MKLLKLHLLNGRSSYINPERIEYMHQATRVVNEQEITYTFIRFASKDYDEYQESVDEIAKKLGYGQPLSSAPNPDASDRFFDQERVS